MTTGTPALTIPPAFACSTSRTPACTYFNTRNRQHETQIRRRAQARIARREDDARGRPADGRQPPQLRLDLAQGRDLARKSSQPGAAQDRQIVHGMIRSDPGYRLT